MTRIHDATDATFQDLLRQAGVPTLVDFWAPWCGPCRALAPIVERAAEHYGDRLQVLKVNVDENPELSRLHDIRSIPALVLFADGAPLARHTGLLGLPDLTALIDDQLQQTASCSRP